MKNIICEKIGIKYPIIQGPMAWASDSKLAAAVSNAGGLGIMGIGFSPVEIFHKKIKSIKKLTDKPFGCNLITAVPYAEDLLNIILEEKVPVVELETMPAFYHSLADYAKKLKDAGIVVIGKASSVEEAVEYEKAGVDFISVKGADGGGHIYGFTGTFSLIPQVVDAVNIPVINSSGIADGRGIAASFMLGAVGVELGSRFLLADECPVHENYKNAIIEAKEGDTVLTGATVGDAVRGLANSLSEKVLKVEKDYEGEEAAKRIQELCSGCLRKAAVNGDVDIEGSVVVGQIVGILYKKQSAKEIMEELIGEYKSILSNSSQYI
ncbi:enoyl-[acyl-carrier protein] reductase II [Clostridium beijerinckii]|nr:enoyl-[acyl-carrier protein] reductase II [Clostridium beijerinckii]NRU37773.1 enoyl-[acyl-carrier protein] reductase II [Clostridium beijerinckii]NSA98949.1 enoyl-[acyl-carrier protein] reductase II [Clostridium beijerinckii]OOM55627.1 nitronate monooxygenase [Clostridium beijerinckii]OOM72534.1 nitronate monooxygenase [Clostridium beijerinckii]